MTRSTVHLAIAAALVSGSAFAAAPASNPKAVANARHEGMEKIGKAFREVNKQLRSGSPDLASVRRQAAEISRLAVASTHWFPAGSGPSAGIKTEAKAEIWSDPAAFRTAQQRFVTEAERFSQVAMSGNAAALAAQAKSLGGACKGCHDRFREED